MAQEPLREEFEEFYKGSPATLLDGAPFTPTLEQIKRLMYGSYMGGYIKATEENIKKLQAIK